MITIKEIANMLGISPTTVSNVIHGKTSEVSKKTVDKVRKLLHDLDYVTNINASNLAQNKSKIIGIAMKARIDKYENLIKDPFMGEIIGAIEKTIRKNGYFMMVYISNEISEIIQYVSTWNVDGLILMGVMDDDCLKIKKKYKKPIVLIDSYASRDLIHHVNIGLADARGGYEITRYLIENGHKRIAFLSDNCEGVDYERFIGYKKALHEFGISYEEDDFILLRPAESQLQSSLEEVWQLSNQYTAFFCVSDYYAALVINYLKDHGKKIPEDASVVGFDDNLFGRMVRPALTTVHQNPSAKGEIAVGKLLEMIDGKEIKDTNIILPVRLVIRDSVRKIN